MIRVSHAKAPLLRLEIESLPINLELTIKELELTLIHAALAKTKNNKLIAATLLGMGRTTLLEKCRRYGVPLRQKRNTSPRGAQDEREA